MKSFTQKKLELIKLKDKLAKSKLTVFTSFARAGEKGLSVKNMQTLKRSLRDADSEYIVEKKTLLNKALESRKSDLLDGVNVFDFDGSLGVVFSYGEETAAAKSVYEFSKKNQALKLYGAIFGKKVLDGKGIIEFAKLPSREVLIGRIMGLVKYPLSALANILGQVAKQK